MVTLPPINPPDRRPALIDVRGPSPYTVRLGPIAMDAYLVQQAAPAAGRVGSSSPCPRDLALNPITSPPLPAKPPPARRPRSSHAPNKRLLWVLRLPFLHTGLLNE